MKRNVFKTIIKRTIVYKLLKKYKTALSFEAAYNEERKKNEYLLKHFDPRDMKPAVGHLRKRQLSIMQYAKSVLDELNDLDINPFLIGGNLIGWMRHGGFVPWDDDLDFGIMRADFNKLLDYAKNAWIVLECPADDKHQQEWIDQMTQKYPGKYIVFVYYAHIQISRGTSCMDRLAVDFFVYDYYKEDVDFSLFNDKVKKIKQQLDNCHMESDRIGIVRNAINDDEVTTDKSSVIYFGLDSCEPYLRTFNTSWIKSETIFPLKKIEYEGVTVNIPNKPEEFMNYEYPNWKKLPNDVGIETHNYWDDYKRAHLTTVEFYLVDAFEIYHFMPFYNYFRNRGVFAVFVAEPTNINVSGNWFDYENAVKLLNQFELEYKTECYPRVDFAFTTQRADCLKKYKNKKINISYGCGLIKNQFGFNIDSIQGFDYKFVHGPFCKELYRRNLDSKTWDFYKEKIFLMGYPKWSKKDINKEAVMTELGIGNTKKIVAFLPTWGEQACIDKYYKQIKELRENYFIITKPHHCTVRLEEEKKNLQMLVECSDIVLESDYDTEKLLCISEMAVCNAESGVSLEIGWLKPEIKLLLITKEKDLDVKYYGEITQIAKINNSPDTFKEDLESIMKEDKCLPFRRKFVVDVFGDRDSDYLQNIYTDVIKPVKKFTFETVQFD